MRVPGKSENKTCLSLCVCVNPSAPAFFCNKNKSFILMNKIAPYKKGKSDCEEEWWRKKGQIKSVACCARKKETFGKVNYSSVLMKRMEVN